MDKMKYKYKLISILLVVLMLVPTIPVFAADTYTVTFLVPNDDGTVEQYPVDVVAGEAIGEENMPANPELPGRVFVGWYYRGEVVTADTIPDGDMYVVAARTSAIVTYTVTFNVPNSVTGIVEQVNVIVKEGNVIGTENIPAIPEVSGKYVIGWVSSGSIITGDYIPVSDMDVYADYGTYSNVRAEIDAVSGIKNGTQLADIELPGIITVYIDDQPRTVEVIWDLASAAYDEHSKQKQTFIVNGTFVVEDASVNRDDLNVSVYVTVDAEESKKEPAFGEDWYFSMLLMLSTTRYSIYATAGEGGSITNSGTTIVKFDGSVTYAIVPNIGYAVESVKVNGIEMGAITEYTFRNVRSNQSIIATFKKVAELEWANPFNDVRMSDDYYTAVKFVYENGLFKGTSDTKFSPNITMSRAMFVTVLGRLARVDISSYTDIHFDDVIAGEYYAPYVEWAVEKGITFGYGDGIFGVNDDVTVEQAIVFMARLAKLYHIPVTSSAIDNKYSDVKDLSEWALNEMSWAVENGIYCVDNFKLNPQNKSARFLVAEIIYNFCNLYNVC